MDKDTVDKWKVMNEELTRLRAENERLREALKDIGLHYTATASIYDIVRAALGAEHE